MGRRRIRCGRHRTLPGRSAQVGSCPGEPSGGLVGELGLWITMAITGNMLSLSVSLLGDIGQAVFGITASSNSTVGAGLAILLFSSILIGVVLSAALLGLSRFSAGFSRAFFPATAPRIAPFGLLGRLLVFLVFGLPMLMGVLAPTMLTILTNVMVRVGASPSMASGMATTKLNGMMPGIAGDFFIGHVVYGTLLAAVACGAVRWELHAHRAAVPRGAGSAA